MVAHPFALQPRDIAVLTTLYECRLMTASHIAALHFEGSWEAAKKRLQKLKGAGYINARPRQQTELESLFLTRKAFKLLNERGVLVAYPKLSLAALEKRARVSDQTLKHELEIMDVKAAFHSALQTAKSFSLKVFSTWPRLYEFEAFRSGQKAVEETVKPDAYIRIEESERDGGLSEREFFLEVDRSKESQALLATKAAGYFDYFKSGGHALRKGGTRSEYKDYPFRALFVFQTAQRRNNTTELLIQHIPPILRLAYLTTLEEVTTNPLGPIWIQPSDYRAATIGTPFDAEVKKPAWIYKSDTAREKFVEENVKKLGILDDGTE